MKHSLHPRKFPPALCRWSSSPWQALTTVVLPHLDFHINGIIYVDFYLAFQIHSYHCFVPFANQLMTIWVFIVWGFYEKSSYEHSCGYVFISLEEICRSGTAGSLSRCYYRHFIDTRLKLGEVKQLAWVHTAWQKFKAKPDLYARWPPIGDRYFLS